MSKDIAIFVMSTFRNKVEDREKSLIEYNDKDGVFSEMCEHTNEAALKYVSWKLKQDNKNLAAAFGFLTDEAQKDFPRFQALFADYDFNIEQVPLYNNGDLTGSFKSICEMFDVLRGYISENEEVVIHIDITGGPRHSVMLMLALIQMIKFSGAKVGMVIYANVLRGKSQIKGMIEDAGDIMDMFTLISGAEEFASIGNVSQIQKYFEPRGNISWCLNSLLDCMEDFSETIRVCGNYKSMTEALAQLKNNIASYENFLKANAGNLCEQELFFGKLLPTIKNEYADIMPHGGENATPVQIIRWCAKRKFLQQAVVFYTEWLPDYLCIDSDLVKVTDFNVYAECEKHKMDWSSWAIYLFKSYTPLVEGSILQQEVDLKITSDKLIYEDLRKLLLNDLSAGEILIKIRGKNDKFETFVRDLIKFDKKTNEKNFAKEVQALDESDLIKIIMENAAPSTTSFENFLNKRIKTMHVSSKVILKALSGIKRTDAVDLFDLSEPEKENNNSTKKNSDRIAVFKQLLKENKMKTKLPVDNLLNFVAQYNEYVGEWRNKFSHAVSEGSNKEKNIGITQAILDSIALIDVKK